MIKIKKHISFILITALILSGLFSFPQTSYAEKTVLSDQIYYHLDIGVQLSYSEGSVWGSRVYGRDDINGSWTISFPQDIEVIDVYPFDGSGYDIDSGSENIPNDLGDSAADAYRIYYEPYASTGWTINRFSGSGNEVNFSYFAALNSSLPLDVVAYGQDRRDGEIYQLFGGKTNLENDQPVIADAIEAALEAGHNGTANGNKLYLVFTPTVIEYKKYITVGDLEAQLSMPATAKQGEEFPLADDSILDDSLTLDYTTVEQVEDDGTRILIARWEGFGASGENSGGSTTQTIDETGRYKYILTAVTTSGQTDTDTKYIDIVDSRDMSVDAILNIPSTTYEGHMELAQDDSIFEVDGEYYSAVRAYAEDIASNNFKSDAAYVNINRLNDTKANVTFSKAGTYSVNLNVKTITRVTDNDNKTVEVLKTPYIIDSLSGFQKQNRKQILNITVATYPGKPLTDYSITLKDKKTGETVALTPGNPQENNAAIKTRAVTMTQDTVKGFAYITVEFLTKTPSFSSTGANTQDFTYDIYVKDSKGDTDTVRKTFTVRPDLPPNAQITVLDSFIRNKGTNIAEIQAEDTSTTDGDQLQRAWTSKGANIETLPGFKDNSFGSRQKVQYNKTGVGKETVRIDVKDVWIEPTLEEYIKEADHLSASTTATTDVLNIAPTVRLEPIDSEEVDVAIVTDKAAESGIKAGINSIKAALIEAGIDANVQVIPTATPNSDGYKRLGAYTWHAAINSKPQKATDIVFDSQYAYAVEASGFQISGYQEVAVPPYIVKAMKPGTVDAPSMTTAWSYTVTESTDFGLLLDDAERYVYLPYKDKGKTVLLNRNNGAYVTSLPVTIPSKPYVTSSNSNLYFLSEDKIEKYDTDTGTMKTVINKGGTLGRLQNGKITFIGKESSLIFYIGQFDMNTETLAYTSIPEVPEYKWTDYRSANGSASSISATDFDTTGKVSFTQTLKVEGDIQGIIIWQADTKTQKVYALGRVASSTDEIRMNSLGFIKDETGKAVSMYHAYSEDRSTSSTTSRWFNLYVYTLGDGDVAPVKRTIYSQNNKRENWTGIMYAKYHTQENAIYLAQGSQFQSSDWGPNTVGIRFKIQLPGWTTSSIEDWDAAEEEGAYNDFFMATYYRYESWMDTEHRIKLFSNSITKDQAEESAMTRLADLAQDAANYIEKSYTNVQNLIDNVKAAVKEKTVLKLSASDTSPISLTRTLKLNPSQTYYYEYEVKKPSGEEEASGKMNVPAPQIIFSNNNVYPGTGNLGSYYVTDMIEEDFNGGEAGLNPFFTLDSGRISSALMTGTTIKYGSNRDLSSSSQISFTIPEGKVAVAIMDVTVNGADPKGWKSGAYINGQRYDYPKMTTGYFYLPGYMHPYLLQPGINTIKGSIRLYSNQIEEDNFTKIDNLKILFLEKTPAPASPTFVSEQSEDGWTKVTGSFKTPEGITELKSQSAPYYPTWPPGFVTSTSPNGNITYYDFVIPTGYTGKVFGTFQGSTYDSDRSIGPFNIGADTYTLRGTETTASINYINNNERWFLGEFQGANQFSIDPPYMSTAKIAKLDTWVYPDNLKGKNNFFFENDKVYAISNTFDGSTSLKINMNPGGADNEVLLQNLKIYYIKDGIKMYLYDKPLQATTELSGWTLPSTVTASMYTETKPEKEDDAPMVYKKGQLVSYNIFYDDYEKDPSKKQYWRYTHTPYNDGPHPDAAFILDEDGNVVSSTGKVLDQSIPRFYIDGKYTVEHWQEDNTNRTGDTSRETDYTRYDKLSNAESITFYVEGGGTAPWITSIKTIPSTVKEGDRYQLQIGVDDAEKDELRLTTELYKDKKLIYTHKQAGIAADANGVYPLTTTGYAPIAEPGKYDVVSTVRDWSGAGIGSYRFTVVSEGKIEGFVNHTDQWDDNRKKYNLKRFSEEVNRPMQLDDYIVLPPPRMRGTNVFWSGEKFLLRSETEGKPWKVDVRIQSVDAQGNRKNTGYSAELTNTGRKAASGAELWEGSLWNAEMINKWGRKSPEPLYFIFTAYCSDGITKTDEVMIIVDSKQDYWQLHRLW